MLIYSKANKRNALRHKTLTLYPSIIYLLFVTTNKGCVDMGDDIWCIVIVLGVGTGMRLAVLLMPRICHAFIGDQILVNHSFWPTVMLETLLTWSWSGGVLAPRASGDSVYICGN